MALAMALFALVVIGLLVAGRFFAGRLEQQSGQNTLYAAQAAEAAEAGLSDALGSSATPPRPLSRSIAVGAQLRRPADGSLASGIRYVTNASSG